MKNRIQESEELSMEDFAEGLEKPFKSIHRRHCEGKILELNADEAIVDIVPIWMGFFR
ncbi:MAG: hypothetical protein ACLTDS_10495 [Bianqueaceae bacterium]